MKKKKKTAEDIVAKHSGILGLCAFVNAFPYDVPDILPDILMVLSDHLHDPQPIPVRFDHFTNCHGQSNWRYRPQNVCNVTWSKSAADFYHQMTLVSYMSSWCHYKNVKENRIGHDSCSSLGKLDMLQFNLLGHGQTAFDDSENNSCCCCCRWPLRRRCKISREPIKIIGKITSSSSRMTNWECWRISWSHQATMLDQQYGRKRTQNIRIYFCYCLAASYVLGTYGESRRIRPIGGSSVPKHARSSGHPPLLPRCCCSQHTAASALFFFDLSSQSVLCVYAASIATNLCVWQPNQQLSLLVQKAFFVKAMKATILWRGCCM